MFAMAMAAVLVCMALLIIRAFTGPTIFDRILVINSFGTKTVLLIAILGFLTGRPDFLDLALVYALMNFIGVIAVLRFTRYGDLVGTIDQPFKSSRFNSSRLSKSSRPVNSSRRSDPDWT